MAIRSFSIVSFNIACSFPGISCREGVLLRQEDAVAEISPLPGWSQETLLESVQSLSSAPAASAAFALQALQEPFPIEWPPIQVAGLVLNEADQRRAWEEGFCVVKIKNRAQIQKLQEKKVRLRIDGNRKWTLRECQEMLQEVSFSELDYLEEPLCNPVELKKLTFCPIALDESLREPIGEELVRLPHVKTLVLKPTLLGKKVFYWIQKGKELGKELVFSSSFESAIGLMHIAHLQYKHAPHLAAGIDTYRFFEQNFLPFSIKKGFLQKNAARGRAWPQEFVP